MLHRVGVDGSGGAYISLEAEAEAYSPANRGTARDGRRHSPAHPLRGRTASGLPNSRLGCRAAPAHGGDRPANCAADTNR